MNNDNYKLEITTFAESPKQIELCAINGVNSFVIEDPVYSLLCRERQTKDDVNFDRLKILINTIKKTGSSTNIIFNLDIIAHNNDFIGLKILIDFLLDNNVNTLRIMDSGIVNYILREYPEMNIQLNTETGNNNYLSIEFWKAKIGKNLNRVILSKELEYNDIIDIIYKTNIRTELQVHGYVMMLYTKRKVIEGLKNIKDNYNIELKEKKREDETFPLITNQHGTFMLHSKHICLIDELMMILDMGINSILIDLRGYDYEIICQTVKIYKKAINYYMKTVNKEHHKDFNPFKKELPSTTRNFFKGFFLENTTDTLSNKLKDDGIKSNDTFSHYKEIGQVVDIVKERIVTLKLKHSIQVGDVLIISTPEGKIIKLKISFIKTIYFKNIKKSSDKGIYGIDWKKGIVRSSLVFLS